MPYPAAVGWGRDLLQIQNDRALQNGVELGLTTLGRPLIEGCTAEAELLRAASDQLFTTGKAFEYRNQPFPVLGSDGRVGTRWLTGSWTPVKNENGRVLGIVATWSDTPEQGCSKAGTQEDRVLWNDTEERWAAIFTHAPIGLSEVGLNGRFLHANQELCRILGRPREQVLTLGIADVTQREDVVPSLEVVAQTLRSGQPCSLDKRYCRPDGTLVWASSTVTRLRDAKGRPGNLLVVTMDLTARKAAEAALAESEGRLRTLIQGIPQLVWRSDSNGWWTWSSLQWQAFTGQSLQESLGLGWLEAVHPEDREEAMKVWERARTTGGLDVEFRLRHDSDSAYYWHHTRSLPVRDDEQHIVEWLGTTTDIQQLKELQERQALMVAELQHRTRNLIAVVASIAQQTMATAHPGSTFAEQFNERLRALARVQGLLSRSDKVPITLDIVIQQELDALGATERAQANGPLVHLRNATVQTLALVIHELATNARKHGALAREAGRLDVSWTVRTSNPKDLRLMLSWVENWPDHLDPTVETCHRGYGRDLIERALPYTLGAATSYEISSHGVRCTIDMPLG